MAANRTPQRYPETNTLTRNTVGDQPTVLR